MRLSSKIVHQRIIYFFFAVLKQKKILGNICFPEKIVYRKKSLVAPDKWIELTRNIGIRNRNNMFCTTPNNVPIFLKFVTRILL